MLQVYHTKTRLNLKNAIDSSHTFKAISYGIVYLSQYLSNSSRCVYMYSKFNRITKPILFFIAVTLFSFKISWLYFVFIF